MTGEAINLAGVTPTNALVDAELGSVQTHHLGYQPDEARAKRSTSLRNGITAKSVLIPKIAYRFAGFGDTMIALYGCGLTAVWEILSWSDRFAVTSPVAGSAHRPWTSSAAAEDTPGRREEPMMSRTRTFRSAGARYRVRTISRGKSIP